jgi:hypothetical protein
MMTKDNDDAILFFIGGKPLTLKDIGPAADMPIAAAMQSIVDQGIIGSQHVGKPWFEVIKSSGFKLERVPDEDEILQHALYQPYKAALDLCKEKSLAGTLLQSDRDNMVRLRRAWQAATKLADI